MTSVLNIPQPTKQSSPAQRSVDVSDLYLTRFTPPWSRPPSLPASTWRSWVLNQPVAMAYREVLVATLLNLDWNITPRNEVYKKELEPAIKYYTRLLNDGGNYLGTDYTGLVEWIAGDILDLPFGGATEIGRKGDKPSGRVMWLRPLDGGTLYPTLNMEYPVVQYYQGYDAVAFPAHSIARAYISPQAAIYREGWGMAPPEKIYFGINLLNSGDKYYANLLLDVPTAGILDLGDMEKSSAEEWITAFKTFVNDSQTSFRVPVLYEHNNPVSFLSFGQVPNDIMFDKIILKYSALVGAAYGASPSDIGLQSTSSSGETLAGSIRDERKTRRTGFARLKLKMKYFFDKILPESLEFNFVDYDDELNVALGRARLASSTAFNLLQQNRNFTQQEIRSQMIEEGLISINVPDKLPTELEKEPEEESVDNQKEKPTEPEVVGDPKAPSGGGEGDVKKLASLVIKPKPKTLETAIKSIVESVTPKVREAINGIGEDELYVAKSVVNDSLFGDDTLGLQAILSDTVSKRVMASVTFDDEEMKSLVGEDHILDVTENIQNGINDFVARTIAFLLNDALFDENMVANVDKGDYDSLMDTVHNRVKSSFEDFLSVLVYDEINNITEMEI